MVLGDGLLRPCRGPDFALEADFKCWNGPISCKFHELQQFSVYIGHGKETAFRLFVWGARMSSERGFSSGTASAAEPEGGRVKLNLWTSAVVFGSLYYLDAGFVKAAVVTVFVLVSCTLGFGRRWLIPFGFVLAIYAIVISIGFPSPSQLFEVVKAIPDLARH